MQTPIEIEVDETDQIVERVAAIDVAKATGMVCTRLPHEGVAGKPVTKVWEVKATTRAILELADHLVCQSIQRVVLESTSDYWRPFYYLLEARGLTVWLVNASQVRHAPGRPKSDKIDAVWLAKLNERNMVSPSFVPPAEIRQIRDWTRARYDLVADRTRAQAARREAAGGRSGQAVECGHRHVRGLGPGDDGGAHRRGAQPQDPGRPGAGPDEAQARRAGRGPGRPVHRPPRPPAADPARPARPPGRRDHRGDRPHR
jgi:transposase